MIKRLLRDVREWMASLIGVVVFTVVGLLLLLPLMWLEHHHHQVFWTIVILLEWLGIACILRMAHGPGMQTCPHCGKRFLGSDMP
jgi:drug/metabolite transporter (DMT)-like permease